MRTNGVLMPIFSLPSPYGVGNLGQEAYRFVDFLAKAGQTYWQILPINPTSYGDSPYQAFSSFAGNPYFIDPLKLVEEGLLTMDELNGFDFGDDPYHVNYEKLYNGRFPMLRLAFERFEADADYKNFCKENKWWLEEYALFMALKKAHDNKSWSEWSMELRTKDKEALKQAKIDHKEEIDFYCFMQYKFNQQWFALKEYANEKGILIMGDIPIYVAYDSADTWSNASQFLLDENMLPTKVAGCPPDAFSADGQLWGNPLYNWKAMKRGKNKYAWWKRRVGYALKLYDWIRIDHFRGFEAFYAIPYGDKTARNGEWMKGPDMDLFNELKAEFGENLPIIAEDLGYLTPEVYKMLAESGFPGMKVLQFAFGKDKESEYLLHNCEKNSVIYTGTHDNDTIMGWLHSGAPEEVEYASKYLHVTSQEGFNWTMMRAAMMAAPNTCILMMSDLVGLGSEARINAPSTLGANWQWRLDGRCVNDWLAGLLYDYTELYCRLSAAALAEKAEKARIAKEKAEAEAKAKAEAEALAKAEAEEVTEA